MNCTRQVYLITIHYDLLVWRRKRQRVNVGGAPKLRATARVLFWGAAAMAITAAVGSIFGVSV